MLKNVNVGTSDEAGFTRLERDSNSVIEFMILAHFLCDVMGHSLIS